MYISLLAFHARDLYTCLRIAHMRLHMCVMRHVRITCCSSEIVRLFFSYSKTDVMNGAPYAEYTWCLASCFLLKFSYIDYIWIRYTVSIQDIFFRLSDLCSPQETDSLSVLFFFANDIIVKICQFSI